MGLADSLDSASESFGASGPASADEPAQAPYYPLFIRLEGARVVVVGAGEVATRKVGPLMDCGADVAVVAPDATRAIRDLAASGRLSWREGAYVPADLDGALLVIAATSDAALNARVHADARARNMLVNVVDVADLCNCIVPSVLRRGRLQIAVSTGGAAPALAREVRRALEADFPDWWESYLDVVAEARSMAKERMPGDARARSALSESLAHAGLRERFAAGERPTAADVYAQAVASFREGGVS